jgi:hypothetical protein
MPRLLSLLAVLAAALLSTPAQAYWEYGHETVARIAYANVRPGTRAAVDRILRDQAMLGTPECPAGTVAEASVWADCIKPLKTPDGASRFGFAYSWHYQNVDICQPFSLAAACKDGHCVSAQIEREVRLLRDPHTTRPERVTALAFLLHFVGDLHQPLHAGDKADRGGNDLKASYGAYAPERFNLHSVWDGPLAERAITSGPSLVRRYPAAVRARIAAGSVEDWSRESWQVSHDVAYALALGGDACAPSPPRTEITPDAIARMVPAARLQVERAGLRLAKLLDEALG